MTTELDLAKIAAHITMLTGHKAGTFEHESMLGRVLGDLVTTGVSSVRDDARRCTYLLDADEFSKRIEALTGGVS